MQTILDLKKGLSIPDGGISRREPALTAGAMEKSDTQSGFDVLTGMEKMLFLWQEKVSSCTQHATMPLMKPRLLKLSRS